MNTPPPDLPRHAVVRQQKRARYDEATVHAILDQGLVAHVGFVADGRPMVMPMAYGRDGDLLYIHGANSTRIIRGTSEGASVCLTVTLIDGIVAARSAFNHSMNYRSVVVHGTARHVTARDEHDQALRIITEHLLPGRWDEVRPMHGKERRATGVLALRIDVVSAKLRSGGPVDDEDDYALPVWGGVLPLQVTSDAPLPDPKVPASRQVPASILAARARYDRPSST